MKQFNLLKIIAITGLLLGSTSVVVAQKVKIKKDAILIDKIPTYQIKEGDKLDRFETYIFSDMQGKKVLVAAPKYLEFEQMLQEEKPYQMPYYEVRLADGTMVAEVEFIPIGYRKKLVNFLVEQKVLGADGVESTVANATADMAMTAEERKELEGHNERRKSMAKSEPFRMYATNLLVTRNPTLPFQESSLQFKVGTTPVAFAKLVEANLGSDVYRYEIHTVKKTDMFSSRSPLLAKITCNKSSKELKITRAYDNSEFSFTINSFFEDKYIEQIAHQLFLEGLL